MLSRSANKTVNELLSAIRRTVDKSLKDVKEALAALKGIVNANTNQKVGAYKRYNI